MLLNILALFGLVAAAAAPKTDVAPQLAQEEAQAVQLVEEAVAEEEGAIAEEEILEEEVALQVVEELAQEEATEVLN